MSSDDIQKQFFAWVDSVLDQPIPAAVVAFNFNLYEAPFTWDVQLVGAPSFDAANPDWACDDIFDSGRPFFGLRRAAGETWEQALETAIDLVRNYLRDGRDGDRLRAARGVGVGFVDGDLQLVWPA